MPAVSSSTIAVLSRQLAPLGEVAPQARGGLLEVLEAVPDPRKKRGVRHRFAAILFVSVCAVVSGARSFAAIAEWAADAVEDTLCGMGIGAPNASTIRRALSALALTNAHPPPGGRSHTEVRAALPGKAYVHQPESRREWAVESQG